MTCFRSLGITAIFMCGLLLFLPQEGSTAGFEVGENTARSVARGGTGVVNKSDPSAVYFNPALLPRARGTQVLLSSNFLTLDVEFQRNDLIFERGGEQRITTFDPVQNQTGIFPAPFVTASFDVGPENLAIGAGIFGPPAYGNPCYGIREDGDCAPDPQSAARGMVTEADLIVAFLGVGAGYRFDLGEERALSLGLTGALGYMQTDFSVFVEANPAVSPPWEENPDQEAFVQAQNLTDFGPTAIAGISYSDGPLRLAASYRPPIRWSASGVVDVRFPEQMSGFGPELSDDRVSLETWHAGSLRLGAGLEGGSHPGGAERPRWDLEVNVIWENWSLVDFFRLELEGDIELRGLGQDEEGNYPTEILNPIYQVKGYQDAYSLRAGFSWGFTPWLTGHTGGFFETAAQSVAYTSADFISWERYSGSLGTTFHLPAGLDLDLAYAFIQSPNRTVRNGNVYNPIPMSQCQGPDFDSERCEVPGTPPGNPQNEGEWRSRFQIVSAGLTWHY